MNDLYKIMLIVFFILIIYKLKNYEHNTIISSQDIQAIQNLSSMFNKGELKISKLHVTNDAQFDKNINNDEKFLVPKKSIIAYHGNTAPEGWAICDGQNGTPDLRGRFILASGKGKHLTNRSLNQKSGEENVTLTAAQMPHHNHQTLIYHIWDSNMSNTSSMSGGHGKGFGGWTGDYNSQVQNPSARWGGRDDKTHGFRSRTTHAGSNHAHNNMPPYYVLTYIMKL